MSATGSPRQNELGQPIGWDVTVPAVARDKIGEPMAGAYCRLEPLDAQAHAQELFAAYTAATDDGDWTYLPYGPFAEPADFAEWLGSVADLEDPVFFTIIDEATGLCCGLASYLRIDDRSASIEVGHIHLSRQLQRTPAATEAMYQMMKRAFECGYRRYEWKCDDLNGPSRAAAARLGFRYEGTFHQATHYKGRNRDTAWFGVVDSSWPAIESEFERWLDPDNFGNDGQQLSPLNHADGSTQ